MEFSQEEKDLLLCALEDYINNLKERETFGQDENTHEIELAKALINQLV